jgi:tape measure domain-containing protein
MDNINGALAFKATLDIDDFNVSAQAMERHIRQVSDTTITESAMMEQSLQNMAQNGAKYIVSYLVGQGMGSLLQSIVTTRGQFQQLEIAFETMLRSGTKSKALMDQLVVTAAKTPFDLQGIASSTKQMLAYGSSVENVVDEIVMLGNVASGVGAPLGEIAYLYGTLRAQGRAYAVDIRQFAGRGIPIYEELAKVIGVSKDEVSALITEGKVGFAEVEQAFKNMTSSSGVYYNLMQEQSKSLTGMISNLGDAWDSALNKIGQENQDVFATGIQGAITLVENYDEILRILQAITIAYGSYKAAIVLNTLVTKGHTGVALLDNTARQAKIALLKIDAQLTGQVSAQTKAMTAAQEAHTISLQKQLTAEEHANLVKSLRIATIQQLLTAQQQEYLSNLNLTASSANYEAVAMSVLSVEQKEALSKTDLSVKSAVYRAALEQEVLKKNQNQASTLNAMRADVSAAAAKVEASKQTAIATMQATEAARYEVYWAKQSGDATRIATAEKKLEGAQENQAIARKAALSAQTDFYAKKKALETAATRQSTVATTADTVAKSTNAATTSLLTAITTRATVAMKALWASMMTNPIGWVIGLVGALVSALTLFSGSEDEATDAMGEFQDTTKKEIDNLNLLFSVLQNTENGTKTHKDAIEKINAICKEYNKTLLDENATLDIQRVKYDELTAAIQNNTAEKIKAKYTEQAMQEMIQSQTDALEELKKAAKDATYKDIQETMQYDGAWVSVSKVVDVDARSIQQATGAVWEAVESMSTEAAERLKGLTGEAYTEAFNQSLDRIVKAVSKSTGATDKEMDSFRSTLSTYLNDIVSSATVAQSKISKVDQQLSAFFEPKNTSNTTEAVDYVSMSFEELEKKAKDTQKEIDEINSKKVKVDTDTSKLNELLSTLKEINDAVDKKTNDLNTESGINARIKQLKDERANVEINSSKYKELTKNINALESRLPKSNNNAAQKTEELSRKQLDAERKLEEDRISIMDEGYEKRKAMLDLQHKQNLDRIDREEKELEKARKEAGKGGLTDTQKAGFQERRNIENKSYTDAQNKLFDGEIEYKKKQYDLYFRWVRTMGEDVARTHFSELLKDGESYKEFVQNQINILKEKQKNQGLTEGEGNYLVSLNMQYNEITGAKTAMDAFKESVTGAISQAQSLADKIQAIADAKERLNNGSSGLVGSDEQSEAILFITEEDEKLQKEIQEKLLSGYRTYEEQRKAIQDEYAVLRNEALRENNQERINLVNQGEAEALSALNAQMLMQSESWKNLFTDLDSLTVEQIDKLIKDIQQKMNTADLDLNPADLKAVLDKLDEAKKKVLDVNPFKAMGNALSDVFKKAESGSQKSSKQIKTEWSNLASSTEGVFGFINDAIDSCDVLGDLIGENGKATLDMLQGITTAGIAMAAAIQTAEKGSIILAAISIALQAVQFVANLFNNDDELEEKIQNIQQHIDNLSNSFDRLQNAAEHTYWVYSDEEKQAHNQRVQAIKDEIAALEAQKIVAQQSWDFVRYAELTKQIKELKYALEKEESNGDMFQLYELQKNNLRQQQEAIRQQIAAEKDKKDTDWGKINDWEEAIKDIDTQIEDMERSMLETLAGTDTQTAIDEFADALVDAYCQGEDAAEALGAKTKDILKKAVVDALKREFLAKAINDAMAYLGEAMKDGVLTDSEKSKFEAMINAAGETFNMALESVGDWIKDVEDEAAENADPLKGAVTSMSEETGGVIAGRLNTFIINQSDQIVIMRTSLVYQAEIAANTRTSAAELAEIKSTLKRIENKDNSLLSQGIS